MARKQEQSEKSGASQLGKSQLTWDGGRSGRPAPAFEEAACGERGWGIRPADIAVIACVVALALAVCLVLWGVYGVQGIPGVGQGTPAQDATDGSATQTLQTDAGSSGQAVDAGAADAIAGYAVVQNSEGFYQALPLDKDATVTVESALGTNVVEVRDGQVRVREADCSNQACVNQGWVSGQGQTIVCLPHKLTVQLVADPADASPLS